MPDAKAKIGSTTPHITKADVRPGDILLLQYEALPNPWDERLKVLGLVEEAVSDWVKGVRFDAKEVAKLMPLVHWAIKSVDGAPFFHAAIVDENRTVVEAGLSGVAVTDLRDYWGGPISVYRYHKGMVDIGSATLPVKPVTRKTGSLLNQANEYGYYHAVLLFLWCLFRHGEGSMMLKLRQALEGTLGRHWTDLILAGGRAETVRLMLVNLFQYLLDLWRRDHYLVCSELVAVCFNEADGDKYHISRATKTSAPHSPEGLSDTSDQLEAVEGLTGLINLIDSVSLNAPLRSVEVTMQAARSDVLYTPGDLALSESTRLVGEMGHE